MLDDGLGNTCRSNSVLWIPIYRRCSLLVIPAEHERPLSEDPRNEDRIFQLRVRLRNEMTMCPGGHFVTEVSHPGDCRLVDVAVPFAGIEVCHARCTRSFDHARLEAEERVAY